MDETSPSAVMILAATTAALALIIHVGDVSACAGSDVDLELVAVW
ncbi:hypothetical protein [Kibdelosporangium philippinense]